MREIKLFVSSFKLLQREKYKKQTCKSTFLLLKRTNIRQTVLKNVFLFIFKLILQFLIHAGCIKIKSRIYSIKIT